MMKANLLNVQPLWVRMVIYFLLLALITLLLFQIIFSYSLRGNLLAYSRGREDTLNRQIISSLYGYYSSADSWAGVRMPLMHIALSTNTRLLLYDQGGQLVGDTGLGRHRMMMLAGQPVNLDEARVYNFALEFEDSAVGELVIAHPLTEDSSVWLQQDLIFRDALTKSLFWTGFAAVSVALLLGIYFSRRLSRPIEDFARAADKITKGDYKLQLSSYQSKEIDHLARYINQLASHLSELEMLRKRSMADIAHELRTPLATLRSYIEAIKDGVMPADPETLNTLMGEISHLTTVANNLDELARAENLQPDRGDYEAVEINSLLKEKIATFTPRYLEKGIDLQLTLPEKLLYSQQNLTALRKIMSNLLDNAYRYTDPGGKVEVLLEETAFLDQFTVAPLGHDISTDNSVHETLKSMFLIKISDTGIGINKDQLPHIFERFFRADLSRERDQDRSGSGIGLALVKELVRSAGGFILVSSDIGKGTTFYLYLPYHL